MSKGSAGLLSVDFDNDAQSFYLAVLSAPGIWHKEALTPGFLEKDVKYSMEETFSGEVENATFRGGR